MMNVFYTVDHIIPESSGGPTTSDDLALACYVCNGFKGTQTTGRDPLTGRVVPLYHPRRQRWSRHFTWLSDNLHVVGRTVCGRATIAALKLNDERHLRLRHLWLMAGSRPPDWEYPSPDEG